VVARVRESLATTHFVLLEALSEHIADLLRKEFNAPWVRVSASKSGVLKGVKRVSVTIERGVR
jgi:dihydroneopterin aldolase